VLDQAKSVGENELEALKAAISSAMMQKPDSHDFDVSNDGVQVVRFMNVTGG
jgi:hypothetical protein